MAVGSGVASERHREGLGSWSNPVCLSHHPPHSFPGSDGACPARGREVRVPPAALAHVRVPGEFLAQAAATARALHDEQRPGELYHPPGDVLGLRGAGAHMWTGVPTTGPQSRGPFHRGTDTLETLQWTLDLGDPFTQGIDVVGTSQRSNERIPHFTGETALENTWWILS